MLISRRFLCSALAGLLLFTAAADAQEVFVRNRPFKGEVASVSGQVFVDVKTLAEMLGAQLQATDSGGWVVGREPATAEQLAQVTAGQVVVAGTPVESQAGANGNVLVPLKTAAELLGARVTPNKQLGTVDVVLATAAVKGSGGAGLGPGVRTINSPGQAVDVVSKLSPGIMNVVEFTAPW